MEERHQFSPGRRDSQKILIHVRWQLSQARKNSEVALSCVRSSIRLRIGSKFLMGKKDLGKFFDAQRRGLGEISLGETS